MSLYYPDQLDRIEDVIEHLYDTLEDLIKLTNKGFKNLMLDYSKMTAAVAAETTTEASVKVLLSQLTGAITELKAEVANAPDMGEVQNKIDAFAAVMAGNADDLQKAVMTNTPTPPPAPSNTTPSNTVFKPSQN